MKNEQLTIDKKDESVIEKMKAIQNLNMQREEVDKLIKALHEIEQRKDEIDGIKIIVKPNFQSIGNVFTLPPEYMANILWQLLLHYKDVDDNLIEEAKQLMK